MLCYDLTSQRSFKFLQAWLEATNQSLESGKEAKPAAIVATKSDLVSLMKVVETEAYELKYELGERFLLFSEVSTHED